MTKRAIVLGGGGPVGIAWESGLLAGLAEGGIDVSAAAVIIGTSAGSAVGAQLAMGRAPQQMYAAVASDSARTTPSPTRGSGAPTPNLMPLMELMQKAATAGSSAEDVRKEIGAFALAASTISEQEFIATFGTMLANAEAWPHPGYQCTAVDALTGEFVTWTAESGVPLSRAVASSCSVPGIYPPITINGRRYIDGGMRSATNADLARGCDVAIVVAVTSNVQGPMAEASRRRLEGELNAIREAGGQAALIQPDEASSTAFGLNLMDFTRRAGAAEAGLAQGRTEAARIAKTWQ
ncbi:MAG: patatin-like phospholipase family protein [Dehalococcoidia bacterium]|nr:patatin-like phospholipase family protein [Dehalococcoidia bacterium]